MRSAIAKGLTCSNHTDFSVTPMDLMRVMWSAVTRRSRAGKVIGPNERVERWESLKALTINAAWQLREEKDKGTIEVGKLADLVILDGNPLTAAEDRILEIKAIETIKEGKSVYQRKT
jgi:predicted amidohydrolase YtcJ